MKNNRLTLLLLLLLTAVAVYFFYTQKSGTIKKELSDFAVADTASIDKLFLADREGHKVTLLRKSAYEWTVNDKYQAKPEAINNLLYTIKALEVRSPVGRNMYNNTIKLMASKSTKIEIYEQGNLVKTYYVGHPTMDNLGTFMYLEGSSVPFIMHIPGFNGYLTSRYFAEEQNWRDQGLLHTSPELIERVFISDLTYPDSTLEVIKTKNNEYTLGNGKQTFSGFDKLKLNSYLSGASNIYFVKTDNEMTQDQRDSIVKAGPFKILAVEAGSKTLKANLYRKPVSVTSRSQYDETTGKIWPFDKDNFYLLRQGDTTWYKCQYFQYDRLLKTPHYFLPSAEGK